MRRRIAAYGVLAIIVTLCVGLFQAAADLRASRESNARQLENDHQLRALISQADTSLGDLLRKQSALLAALPADLDESTAAARDDLADATSRLLEVKPTAVPSNVMVQPGKSPTVVVSVPPAAPAARPVPVAPGARPPAPRTSTPSPTPVAVPAHRCSLELLGVCVAR